MIAAALLAPWVQAVLGQAPPAAEKPKRVGSETCLMCHSDRHEMVEFAHREPTEELAGCETCHGPGSVHASTRGAPGTIRDLRAEPPAKANRVCLLCHSDMAPPEHFTPAPGRERCTDCHVVHAPPSATVAP
ncbi:MAG: multiheme c-type cytochrome, partial [Planctomycetota bacterium]